MIRTRATNCSGFTLLELLVAMALMVVVTALSVTSLSFGRAALERADRTVKRTESVGNVQRRITEWIERAYPFDASRSAQLVFAPMFGDDRTLVFSTSLAARAEYNNLSRVQLVFDKAQKSLILRHQPDRNDVDEPDLSASEQILLVGVEHAEFTFLEAGVPARWVATWTERNAFPLAVRLEIDFESGDDRSFPGLVVSPRIEEAAWCDFDPVSRECRAREDAR